MSAHPILLPPTPLYIIITKKMCVILSHIINTPPYIIFAKTGVSAHPYIITPHPPLHHLHTHRCQLNTPPPSLYDQRPLFIICILSTSYSYNTNTSRKPTSSHPTSSSSHYITSYYLISSHLIIVTSTGITHASNVILSHHILHHHIQPQPHHRHTNRHAPLHHILQYHIIPHHLHTSSSSHQQA